MATQSPVSTPLSKEAVSALRRRMRAPLHQIISYAEIIMEEARQKNHPAITAHLSGIIATCEAVLQITAAFQPDAESLEPSFDKLRQQLLAHCKDLFSLSTALQHDAPVEQFASRQPDIAKLRHAAGAFETLVSGINTEKVLVLAASEARPAPSAGTEVSRQRTAARTPAVTGEKPIR